MTIKRLALPLLALLLSGCAGMFARARVTVEAEAGRDGKKAAALAAGAGSVGNCIYEKTHTVKYITCAPSGTPGVWSTAVVPFNPAVVYEPFVSSPEAYYGRYSHELSLNRAESLGKPPSAANCGTPVGERYSDFAAYEKFPTLCPSLPAGYVITSQDRNDMKMAAYGSSTWWDTFIVPTTPTTPRSDYCNEPGATCHQACPTCPPIPPNPCPHPALVPEDIRATLDAAPGWLPRAQVARRARLQRADAWLELVAAYCARTEAEARAAEAGRVHEPEDE